MLFGANMSSYSQIPQSKRAFTPEAKPSALIERNEADSTWLRMVVAMAVRPLLADHPFTPISPGGPGRGCGRPFPPLPDQKLPPRRPRAALRLCSDGECLTSSAPHHLHLLSLLLLVCPPLTPRTPAPLHVVASTSRCHRYLLLHRPRPCATRFRPLLVLSSGAASSSFYAPLPRLLPPPRLPLSRTGNYSPAPALPPSPPPSPANPGATLSPPPMVSAVAGYQDAGGRQRSPTSRLPPLHLL